MTHWRASRSKYGNIAVEIDGIRFASKREGNRYAELKLLAKAGEIRGLTLQPKFECWINGFKVLTYFADFEYWDNNGKRFVEDAKGIRTPVYKLKKKIIEAQHLIEITEV